MKLYNVSYHRNGIYHANLVEAENTEIIYNWFKNNKPEARIVGTCIATADDYRPHKPVIKIKEL